MNLVEIFSSVQGEGPHVGATTLFVRFGECDLRCRWCDSPHTWRPALECRVGSRSIPNPVPIEAALEAVLALGLARHRFVAFTGGEPLLQPEAVAALAEALRGRGPRLFLETHGLAAEALGAVVHLLDVVSMDWKLASEVRGPGWPFHEAHSRFLEVARKAPEVIVKIVVTAASEDAEIDEAVARVAAQDPSISLVLQPVTPFGAVRERPDARRLLELVERASRSLRDVRLIPQTHPLIGAP